MIYELAYDFIICLLCSSGCLGHHLFIELIGRLGFYREFFFHEVIWDYVSCMDNSLSELILFIQIALMIHVIQLWLLVWWINVICMDNVISVGMLCRISSMGLTIHCTSGP